MFEFNKKKCTEEISGSIIKKRWNGNLWFITVEYTVDGKQYLVTEQLRYNITKVHKIWIIPFGYRKKAALDSIEVGTNVRVKYNPNKPKQSYLMDNSGHKLS